LCGNDKAGQAVSMRLAGLLLQAAASALELHA